MKIGVPKATLGGERRVALIPDTCARLIKSGHEILVEAGAGSTASYHDADYQKAGAKILSGPRELYDAAEIILLVHPPGANELTQLKPGNILMAPLNPLVNFELVSNLADKRVTALALELVPRITRAQSMDVLSSMSSLAGYKAVVMAADTLGKIFPMMMTAAGTITPAKVLILGAGVAGLQAIATAKRLGAVVSAFDVRPVVKEQVESLGAKFVDVGMTEEAQDKGGYAKEVSEAYKAKQREVIAKTIAESDVAISTALIPGKPAPILITRDMVHGMRSGSVIIDLAAEAGGNCELTTYGETVVENNVTIIGPRNLPATVPVHASQMLSRNMLALLNEFTKDGQFTLDPTNEIVSGMLVTQNGLVVHSRIREMMGQSREAVTV